MTRNTKELENQEHTQERTAKTPKDPLAVEIGKRVKQARIDAQFEINAVADALGYDRQTIGTWENGFAFPPIKKLIALTQLYGVTPDAILLAPDPNAWEGAVARMPADLRNKTILVATRDEIGDLVPVLAKLDADEISVVSRLLSHLGVLGRSGLRATDKILAGMVELVSTAGSKLEENRGK